MDSDSDTLPSCPGRVGCPIRRPRDHRSLASPPGFSQRAASFIASQCQGIHQMPLCSLDPRRRSRVQPDGQTRKPRPGKPPRTGASPQTASGRQRRPNRCLGPPHPLPPAHPRGVSHEDTSFGRSRSPARAHNDTRLRPGPSASVTFTNSLHPFNQHPSRNRGRRAETPVRPPRTAGQTWLLRMSVQIAEIAGQRPQD
jgi:hypothetical protein